MKKGFMLLTFLAMTSFLFADDMASPTTVTAVQDGDMVKVTITWKPADSYTTVELRGTYQGDQAGNFAWGAGAPQMTKGADGSWSISFSKKLGDAFEYKFFADGDWMDDEINYPQTVGNPFGGVNGFAKVDEGLLAGKATKGFSPKLSMQYNIPTRLNFNDTAGASGYASVTTPLWLKATLTILPNVTIFAQTSLAGGSDNSFNIWTEAGGFSPDLGKLFLNGFSTIVNPNNTKPNVPLLTHFSIEYSTPSVDIAWLAHFAKPLADTIGANDGYYFRIDRNDNAIGINALGGDFRLSKSSLPIGGGYKLTYSANWGGFARGLWNAPGDADWGGIAVNWDTNFNFTYGTTNFFYFTNPALVDFMVAYNGVFHDANMGAGTGAGLGNPQDIFKRLDSEIVLGAKGKASIVSYMAQLMTMFAGDSSVYVKDDMDIQAANKGGTWSVGKYLNFGAIVSFDLNPITIKLDGMIGGRDYTTGRFFNFNDFGWEDNAKGVNVEGDGLRGLARLKGTVAYAAGGFNVGIDNTFKMKSPLNDYSAFDKNSYYTAKAYAGISAGALAADAYTTFWYTIYDGGTPAAKNAFGIDSIGGKVGYELGTVLKNISLSYVFTIYGNSTSTDTTDDATGHSAILGATLLKDTYVGLGIAAVTGETVKTLTDDQQSYAIGLSIEQPITVMDRLGSKLFLHLSDGKLGNDTNAFFDGDAGQYNWKINTDNPYRFDRMGSAAITKMINITIGGWLDF